jgi:hypothetical protein
VPGDDRYHENSSNQLATVALDPYGRRTYIEVYSTGTENVDWTIIAEPFIKLAQRKGTLCPSCDETGDVRIYVSIDWEAAPKGFGSTLLNFTVEHVGPTYQFTPSVAVTYNHTVLPEDFATGFIESDRHISIEEEHYTRLTPGIYRAGYTLLPGYGRTLSAVSLSDHLSDRLTTKTAPTLEYDFYKLSDVGEVFSVTMIMGTGLNTHSGRPLTYALQFDDGEVREVAYIGEAPPGRGARPDGWEDAVFDAAWVNTTTWDAPLDAGKHVLKVWVLEPGTVLRKILLNFGGQRPSYLGPPESMLLS